MFLHIDFFAFQGILGLREAAAEPFPHRCTPKRTNPVRFGDPALGLTKDSTSEFGMAGGCGDRISVAKLVSRSR
jgi:hypothetical protein